MHRRQYLAIAGAVALAGCSALSSEPDIERVDWQSRETESTATGEVVRGEIVLEAREYTDQGFVGIGAPGLAWEVRDVSGGAVDVWVMTAADYESFESGEDTRYVTSLSERGVESAAEARGRVDGSRDWYIVFDNTGRGDSTADDRVAFRAAAAIGA